MKKLLFVFGLSAAVLGISASTLTTANLVTVESKKDDDKKKVEVPPSSLPEKISKSITDANKDSKITKAFKVLDDQGNLAGYEVVVLTDTKEETLHFDKDGAVKM